MIEAIELEEIKMIKISKTYHLAPTEEQAKELYQLLRTERDSGFLTLIKNWWLFITNSKTSLILEYDEATP
jgi:non-homologous end joining protein Ku